MLTLFRTASSSQCEQQEDEGLCFTLHMHRDSCCILCSPEAQKLKLEDWDVNVFWSKVTSGRRCSMYRGFQNNVL